MHNTLFWLNKNICESLFTFLLINIRSLWVTKNELESIITVTHSHNVPIKHHFFLFRVLPVHSQYLFGLPFFRKVYLKLSWWLFRTNISCISLLNKLNLLCFFFDHMFNLWSNNNWIRLGHCRLFAYLRLCDTRQRHLNLRLKCWSKVCF